MTETRSRMSRSATPTVDEKRDRPPLLVSERNEMLKAGRAVASTAIGVVG